MELGHEIPLAGHLGKETENFEEILLAYAIQGCGGVRVTRQKASTGKVPVTPLISLPVISEPFKRVAMDIVGYIYSGAM